MIKIQVLNNLEYDIEKKEFENCTITDFSRYLKGQYGNVNRLNERFFNSLTNPLAKELKKQVYDIFDEITPFTYAEAFEIKNDMFKSLVFGSINIVEMIKELGSKRIKTDGKRVVRKQYDFEGKYIGDKEYDNIYETYEVSGKKLGVENFDMADTEIKKGTPSEFKRIFGKSMANRLVSRVVLNKFIKEVA